MHYLYRRAESISHDPYFTVSCISAARKAFLRETSLSKLPVYRYTHTLIAYELKFNSMDCEVKFSEYLAAYNSPGVSITDTYRAHIFMGISNVHDSSLHHVGSSIRHLRE